MVPTWLRRLARAKSRPSPRGCGTRAGRRSGFRPALEALEDRLTPTSHQWTGAVSEAWSDPGNWAGGSPVGDSSAVLIFPTSATRFTSLNDQASIPVQEIDIFGSGYVIGTTAVGNRIALGSGGINASISAGTS